MGDFEQKLFLAFLAFILGLLADVIKKSFQRERRQVTYSVLKQPIISVNPSLPNEVLGKLPSDQTLNIINFRIVGENTGTQVVSDVNLLVVADKDSELLHQAVTTIPPREVNYPSLEQTKPNEVRYSGIKLERKQSIAFDIYLKSRFDIQVHLYWSGGENVGWSLSSATEAFGLEEHIVAIIRNYIFAVFMPQLFNGIFILFAGLASLTPMTRSEIFSGIFMGSSGLGTIIGSLFQFYFYLRIVPHAIAVLREITTRRSTKA